MHVGVKIYGDDEVMCWNRRYAEGKIQTPSFTLVYPEILDKIFEICGWCGVRVVVLAGGGKFEGDCRVTNQSLEQHQHQPVYHVERNSLP